MPAHFMIFEKSICKWIWRAGTKITAKRTTCEYKRLRDRWWPWNSQWLIFHRSWRSFDHWKVTTSSEGFNIILSDFLGIFHSQMIATHALWVDNGSVSEWHPLPSGKAQSPDWESPVWLWENDSLKHSEVCGNMWIYVPWFWNYPIHL